MRCSSPRRCLPALPLGLRAEPGLDVSPGQLQGRDERLAVAAEDREVVLSFSRLEPDPQPRADEAPHPSDLLQLTPAPPPAFEGAAERVVDVILLDPVPLVELELALHLAGAVARREDLEDHVGCDPALDPLPVRPALPPRPAEGDHDIRRTADGRFALDGVPQEVGPHEDVRDRPRTGLPALPG